MNKDPNRLKITEIFEAAFVHAGTPSAISSLDGQFPQMNEAFCRFLGFTLPPLTQASRSHSEPWSLRNLIGEFGDMLLGPDPSALPA